MNRNEGIDLLRIFAMAMVVMLHTLSASNILNEDTTSIYYRSGWFVEILSFCAVNCYGLISGYVATDKANGFQKLKKTWMLALFYSVSLTLVCFAITKTFSLSTIIKSFFPVIFDQWWYFTSFFCMSLFAPYINKVFSDITEKDCKHIFWSIVCIFTVFSSINTRMAVGGYTVIWLICLYVMGKCLRKGKVFKDVSPVKWCILYLALAIMTWVVKMVRSDISIVSYTSPTILFCAIALVMAFKEIKLPEKVKNIVIGPMAQTNFSIYLFHAHPLMWVLIGQRVLEITTTLRQESLVMFWLGIMAIVIFVCCIASIIDYCRIYVLKLIKGR